MTRKDNGVTITVLKHVGPETHKKLEIEFEELVSTYRLEDILSVYQTICLLKAMRIRETESYRKTAQIWERRAKALRDCIIACKDDE